MQHAPHDVSHLLVHKRRRNRSVMMCYNCHNCTNSVTICADGFTWHHGPIWRRYVIVTVTSRLHHHHHLLVYNCSRQVHWPAQVATSARARSHRMNHFNLFFSARLRVRRVLRVITGDYGCLCFFQVFNGYIGPKRCKPYRLRIQTIAALWIPCCAVHAKIIQNTTRYNKFSYSLLVVFCRYLAFSCVVICADMQFSWEVLSWLNKLFRAGKQEKQLNLS